MLTTLIFGKNEVNVSYYNHISLDVNSLNE